MSKEPISSRRRWFSHLGVFFVAQLLFFIFDDFTSHWTLFNLNPVGEWVVTNIGFIWSWFNIYEFPMFNLVTLVWGLLLIIKGFLTFIIKPRVP